LLNLCEAAPQESLVQLISPSVLACLHISETGHPRGHKSRGLKVYTQNSDMENPFSIS